MIYFVKFSSNSRRSYSSYSNLRMRVSQYIDTNLKHLSINNNIGNFGVMVSNTQANLVVSYRRVESNNLHCPIITATFFPNGREDLSYADQPKTELKSVRSLFKLIRNYLDASTL